MSEIKITFNELMSELDKYRGRKTSPRFNLTDDQIEFIKKCRFEKPERVTFETMCNLWKKLGWGDMKITALRDRTSYVRQEKL